MTTDLLIAPSLVDASALIAEACRIMAPPPRLSVSEWADTRRVLGANAAESGQWRTSRAPYLREIMDAFSDPRVTEVTFKKSAQVGGTECVNNVIGYFMDQDPSTIMYACETEAKAEAWSKERFMDMCTVTPALKDKLVFGRGPTSANTILFKEFPGGYITIVGAGSDAALASRPVRVLIKDELSKWHDTKTGDPDSRADMRTSTYLGRKKIGNISTPMEHHPPDVSDRITMKYESSDKRKYHVPCPFCGHEQVLRRSQLRFTRPGNTGDKIEGEAKYECEKCGAQISHLHKRRMLAAGRWIAEKPFAGHAGFWINALYSPWVTWTEYVEKWLKDKRMPETHRTFVNEWDGEAWDPLMTVDKDISVYTKRCEPYDKVPLGAAILTGFVDVQQEPPRLEAEVRAWGVGGESWGMAHRIFYADGPLDTAHGAKAWADMLAFVTQTWEHECGEVLRPSRIFVDMGYLQHVVVKFCRGKRGLGLWPSKGMSDHKAPLVSRRPVKSTKDRTFYYPIGPNAGKEAIFGRMELEEEGPGYMHFRKGQYDDEYFRQLMLSERYKWVKGVKVYEKISSAARNEALDLCVGNLAAFESLGVDPATYVEALRARWEQMQSAEGGVRSEEQDAGAGRALPGAKRTLAPKRKGNWVTGWRR